MLETDEREPFQRNDFRREISNAAGRGFETRKFHQHAALLGHDIPFDDRSIRFFNADDFYRTYSSTLCAAYASSMM